MASAARYALALLLALSATPAAAGAQAVLLQPGVRLRLPGIGEGTVALRTPDSLYVFTKAGQTLTLPLRTLRTVEVSGPRERGPAALRGAWIGGAIGLAAGLLVWAAGDSAGCKTDAFGEEYDCTRTFNAGDAGLAGVGGAAIGAGIGALIGRQRWQKIVVSQPEAVRLYMLPARRLALAVRLRRASP